MRRSGAMALALALSVIMSGASAAGCMGPRNKPPVDVSPDLKLPVKLEPAPYFAYELDGYPSVQLYAPELISPDGKYLLANVEGSIRALPLAPGLQMKTLYSAPGNTFQRISCMPVGWLSPERCLFVAPGRDESGQAQAADTVVLYEGNPVSGNCSAITSFAFPQGLLRRLAFDRIAGKVFLHVSGAIWEMDVAAKTSKPVRSDLPTWDGLFQAIPSPTGRFFIYNMPIDGHTALTLLDTGSAVERVIHESGLGWSFYPQWSPDGRYAAAFMADKKEGSPGTRSTDFEVIPSEDGPYPAAKALVIYDTETSSCGTVRVEGEWLSYPAWSPDSKMLLFLSGTLAYDPEGGVFPESVRPSWRTLWAVAPAHPDTPVKIGDLSKVQLTQDSTAGIQAAFPGGKAALIGIWSTSGDNWSLWLFEQGKDPVTVPGGPPTMVPAPALLLPGNLQPIAVQRGLGRTGTDLLLLGQDSGRPTAKLAVKGDDAETMYVMGRTHDSLVLTIMGPEESWVLAVYKAADLTR